MDYLLDESQAFLGEDGRGNEIDIKVEQNGAGEVRIGARAVFVVQKGMGMLGTIPPVPFKPRGGQQIVVKTGTQAPNPDGMERALWTKNPARRFSRANVSAVGSSRLSLRQEGENHASFAGRTGGGAHPSRPKNLASAYSASSLRANGLLQP